MTDLQHDLATRWTPSKEQDEEAFVMLNELTARGIGSCGFCGELAHQTSDGSRHVESGKKRCWEGQNTLARKDRLVLVTAHLLVGKEHGFWAEGIDIEPVHGVFTDRNAVHVALAAVGPARHRVTGRPISGGYTTHTLSNGVQRSSDGTIWQTQWAVFEDILSIWPDPSWRRK